jgi:hypothetical protein
VALTSTTSLGASTNLDANGVTGGSPTDPKAVQGVYLGPTGGSSVTGPYGMGRRVGYEAWLDHSVAWVLDFVSRVNWTDVDNFGYVMSPYIAAGQQSSLILSIPMGVVDDVGDGSYNPTNLAAGARGDYNSHYAGMATSLVANGFQNCVIRVGHEFNGSWYPWYVGGTRVDIDPSSATFNQTLPGSTFYKRFWIKIVTAMRAVSGANFKFVWCPTVGDQYDGASYINPADSYPGDAYVDVIAVDTYSQAYPTPVANNDPSNYAEIWDYQLNSSNGLQWCRNLANGAAGSARAGLGVKQEGFTEWGVGQREDGHGLGDSPEYVQLMYDWIAAGNVHHANYYNTPPDLAWGDYQDEPGVSIYFPEGWPDSKGYSRPFVAAKYAELFGGPNAGTYPPPPPSTDTFNTAVDAVAGGPTSHWKLNEDPGFTAVDRKAHRDLSYSFGVFRTQPNLIPYNNGTDGAIKVIGDGANVYEVASTIAPVATAWTFAAWIEAAAVGAEYPVMGQQTFRFGLGIKPGGFNFYVNANGVYPEVVAGTPAVNTIYLIAGTYTGTSVKLHVNGVQAGSTVSAPGALAASGTNFEIGRSTNVAFNGWIDEVMYWEGTALSDAQHLALYQAGTVPGAVTVSLDTGSATAAGGSVARVITVPANLIAPSITPTSAQSHQILTCANGSWSGTPTLYTYQWRRVGSPISGAIAQTYYLQSADVGQAISCQVTGINGAGASSPATSSNSVTPTADTTAPAAPTGLSASGSVIGISLAWNSNTEPDLNPSNPYIVERATVAAGPYTTVATTTSASYLDTSVASGTTYYYRVRAQDGEP